MSDTHMEVDEPAAPSAPVNAMSSLMANAKGKAKAANGDGEGAQSQAEMKAANEREGLPWSVSLRRTHPVWIACSNPQEH